MAEKHGSIQMRHKMWIFFSTKQLTNKCSFLEILPYFYSILQRYKSFEIKIVHVLLEHIYNGGLVLY